jgi:hypothetical protein
MSNKNIFTFLIVVASSWALSSIIVVNFLSDAYSKSGNKTASLAVIILSITFLNFKNIKLPKFLNRPVLYFLCVRSAFYLLLYILPHSFIHEYLDYKNANVIAAWVISLTIALIVYREDLPLSVIKGDKAIGNDELL